MHVASPVDGGELGAWGLSEATEYRETKERGGLYISTCTAIGSPISTVYARIKCVCVCFLPIHSGHQWTYQPGSHRRKVTQEEGHTEFFIHLLSAVRAFIFLARRIRPFVSVVDREVEFCVLTI